MQKRPRSRSLSQLPDDCILSCRSSSLLNDKKDTSLNVSQNESGNSESCADKVKNKSAKDSKKEKSQNDSDTSDDERMVICEEDTNSGQ